MSSQAIDILNKHHIKYSKQRESLIDVLLVQDQPITMEHLYEKVKASNASINLSTVYRIVDTLDAHHVLEKSYNTITQANMVKIKKGSHTHYLVCVSCHQLIPIETCPMSSIIKNVETTYGFKVASHQLEISGTCQNCLTKTTT